MTKRIAFLTGTLTLLLALFSFVLSFNALTDLAAKHGISIPVLFPLTVEAAVVIFSLNALYRSLHNESARWQWALIIGSSFLAGAFNVFHAQADMLSRLMAAMPSLFLLLSFETFLGQVKHSVKKSEMSTTLTELQKEIDKCHDILRQTVADNDKRFVAMRDKLRQRFVVERDKCHEELRQLDDRIKVKMSQLTKLDDKISDKTNDKPDDKPGLSQDLNDKKQLKIDDRRRQVVELLSRGLSEDVIAEELDVSIRTVQRDIAALESSNGVVR